MVRQTPASLTGAVPMVDEVVHGVSEGVGHSVEHVGGGQGVHIHILVPACAGWTIRKMQGQV